MSRCDARRAVAVLGVVLPVHDEENLLPSSLQSLEMALNALPPSISCRVAVVLDDCGDTSAEIAHAWGARVGGVVISRECGSVGAARRAGGRALLSLWPDKDPARIWLATTDADSLVPRDWLVVQLQAYSSGADMWAGRVRVAEESAAALRWGQRYAAERNPVHGANLGFSATLYTQLGGFGRMRTGEDRDLHNRAVTAGFRIAYDLRAPVTTSSRRKGRAPAGFANVLDDADQEELGATA
jgi:cellulose synthase/poly-beta-1,6-N-acetylglucosamine synthase-like glycosyltransferase